MVHSALGRIGWFEDGVDGFLRALIEAVGPDGTISMMTDTRTFTRTRRFAMDQPSENGMLTERFRLLPGVVRSCVPMLSFCALGPRAEEYAQRYHSHLDATAPITRLLANDGMVMLVGISYEKCTLFHLAEERIAVPYNFYKDFTGTLVEDGREVGPINQRYFVRRDLAATKKDPRVAGDMLEREGKARIVRLGDGVIRTFLARDFDDCCTRALDADPNAFLVQPQLATSEG